MVTLTIGFAVAFTVGLAVAGFPVVFSIFFVVFPMVTFGLAVVAFAAVVASTFFVAP